MHLAAMTAQQIGGLVWNLLMAGAGIGLAITGPKYLHLIDKGFRAKSRNNPEGAAKQVKTFRIIGAALGVCGLALAIMRLLGAS
jgi:hypothetical protein